MKVLIRADSSLEIGTGHLVRCLALADRLRGSGVAVSFACREDKGNVTELATRKGYQVHCLPAGIGLDEDRELTGRILSMRHVDWLLVDHYALDISWESPLRRLVKNIMVIDDLANRRHDCDILLDQNYMPEGRYDEIVPRGCVRLIGPKYALLRPQFLKARETMMERTGEVKKILVFMGGTDPFNETGKALRAIRLLSRPDIVTDVVSSHSCPHLSQIHVASMGMQNTFLHVDVQNMAELMSNADLAIGAGGTATWERCSLGLPSLVITIADNQVEVAKRLADDGYIFYAGCREDIGDAFLFGELHFILGHPEILMRTSLRVRNLVDGEGVERVFNKLTKVCA
jgi:UDP-2,4-diacetamido-2,4,6-trideoxy-beta-L-altropyranose hydrolase